MKRLHIRHPYIMLTGMPLHQIRMNELLDYCNKAVEERSRLVLGMVNVAKLVKSRKDEHLRHGLQQADLVAADGQGIVWLSRLAGKPLPERVTGIDVMTMLMERGNRFGYRVFFLGARPEVVREVVEKATNLYPDLKIAGYHDGYFDIDSEGRQVAEVIKASRADVLFVAITPPKKEIFIDRWNDFMEIPVCHGVGGSFDVFAGRTKRAPHWMQSAGLEWFFRILQEPKRMWKRYLVTNTIFLFLGIREIITARLKPLK